MPLPRDDHVFINCPFDDEYRPLFHAIVFAVHDAGFVARCSLEVSDAAENRLATILRIIAECRFGIHDISRTDTNAAKLPRFNMPLELGLFLACKAFGGKRQAVKSCVILDREPYRYQQFISDIAGQDISAHSNDPRQVIRAVRNWLRTSSGRTNVPGAELIATRYDAFRGDLPAIYSKLHITSTEITFADYAHVVVEWLKLNAL